MAGQIEDYRNEIFHFLRTVTIKFEPLAYLSAKAYCTAKKIEIMPDDYDADWNPYYLNLVGQYSDTQTKMTVYSIEEKRQVPFDRDLFTKYPKTAALYRVGKDAYTILEERYPDNRGLIQNIVYPVSDIDTAINANNLTLLAYDDSYLDYNERDDLVEYLKSFLNVVRTRWWVPEFQYEDMYAVTFWAMLWQHLPLLLLSRRFQNIGTPQAHTFHIWEKLKSRGLGDYRDVLTNDQALWLYRNIDYLLKNQGKEETLQLLAENLLDSVFVSLLKKDMQQETATAWATDLRTNPIFVSKNYITGNEDKTETFAVLNRRLVDMGVEQRDDADYVADTNEKLGTINYNTLPTKFLEFKKDPVNTSNQTVMTNFFLDTLMYRYSTKDLMYRCELTDPVGGSKIKLAVGDLILLWHWSIQKYLGYEPDKLPTKYKVHIPFRKNDVTIDDFKEPIVFAGQSYSVPTLIPAGDLLKMIDWHTRSYVDVDDFIQTSADQLRDILAFNRYIASTNRLQSHLAMNLFEQKVLVQEWVTLDWGQLTTFDEWLASNQNLSTIVTSYAKRNNADEFDKLGSACFDALFPLDNASLDEFLGSLRNMEKIYASIRDLFIQLCSYNITYLETERDVHQYLNYFDPDLADFLTLQYHLGTIYLPQDDPVIKTAHVVDIGAPDLVLDTFTGIGDLITRIKGYIEHHYHIDSNIVFTGRDHIRYDLRLGHSNKIVVQYRAKVDTGGICPVEQ